MSDIEQAQPFLKWAGGKRQLEEPILKEIDRIHPSPIPIYIEAFLGGGAIFFALARKGRIQVAHLSDANDELVRTYNAVKRDVNGVIRELRKLLKEPVSEKAYYAIRAAKPRKEAAVAARMIYLNKTGFNGLYRVNKSGAFNVPYGRWKKPPRVLNEEVLRAASVALAKAAISCSSWVPSSEVVQPGVVAYFDPPYAPVSKSSDFTAYQKAGFKVEDQRQLAEHMAYHAQRGHDVILSNSNTAFTRNLYLGLEVKKLRARRSINSKADSRGAVLELLVTSRIKKAKTK